MLHSTNSQQRRAISGSLSPQQESYQGDTSIEADYPVNGSLRRKGSFSFLRRSKSRERSTSASHTPARKLSKKDRLRVRQQDTKQEHMPSPPPRIPIIPHPPDLQGFGGEEIGPDVMSNRAGGSFRHRLAQKTSQETFGSDMYRGMPVPPVPPIPPIPGTITTPKTYIDAFPTTESLVNRGR